MNSNTRGFTVGDMLILLGALLIIGLVWNSAKYKEEKPTLDQNSSLIKKNTNLISSNKI